MVTSLFSIPFTHQTGCFNPYNPFLLFSGICLISASSFFSIIPTLQCPQCNPKEISIILRSPVNCGGYSSPVRNCQSRTDSIFGLNGLCHKVLCTWVTISPKCGKSSC
uniref:Putative product n=1 Tax=Xenopsylla cheopis TaxID=163159 RepID=A0A6M2DIB9_XENCH